MPFPKSDGTRPTPALLSTSEELTTGTPGKGRRDASADERVNEAALAAEVSAAHAVKAAEQAEAAEVAALEAAKPDPNSRLCPNCRAVLLQHGPANHFKAGSWHCSNCGACWAPGLKHMRTGHPAPAGVT